MYVCMKLCMGRGRSGTGKVSANGVTQRLLWFRDSGIIVEQGKLLWMGSERRVPGQGSG